MFIHWEPNPSRFNHEETDPPNPVFCYHIQWTKCLEYSIQIKRWAKTTISSSSEQDRLEIDDRHDLTWPAWIHRWSNHPNPPNSGFHAANALTPMLSPSRRFIDSDHKTFSHLIQFRTGHAHIGEYYMRFVRTEDPMCGCSRMTQTRLHILRECPKYTTHRSILGTGRNAQFEKLVGTEKGIKRLAKFITITKAIDKHRTQSTAMAPHTMANRLQEGGRQGVG